MEIIDLIDQLEELVIQARRLPVGGNLVIDRKRILDLIDQMRLALPADLREASEVLRTRDEILDEADDHARATVQRAEDERLRRIDETSLMREAHERSQAMLMEAESRSRLTVAEADATAAAHLSEAAEAAAKELDDADQYALEVLRRLDGQLHAFLDSVRSSIVSLQDRR
ncbi:MAG: hypothetical protein ACKVVT_08255 [Dehalococcoidia bacterium]